MGPLKRIVTALAVSLFIAGCASQQDIDQLVSELQATRAEIAAQPTTPQTGRVLAVLDQAGNVIERIPVIEDAADIGGTVTATAPLAGPYAPWVALVGGVLSALTAAGYFKRREDKAFDEGAARASTGEIKPSPPAS